MNIVVLLALMTGAAAFKAVYPSSLLAQRSTTIMAVSWDAKKVGAVFVAASMIALPVVAKEGDPAKISIFGNNDISSPFSAGEVREDPIYSPYSPYGNGEKAAYKRGNAEEVKFYTAKFEEGAKRVSNIPGYVAKKTWTEATGELTRFTNTIRESMIRLAEVSKTPDVAKKAADKYFRDLEEMFVFSTRKDGARVVAAYERSLADLAAYRSVI